MKEHTNIGSILISTGEHAYIYVREENRHNQTKFKHGHFELDDLEDRANYNLSHEDLFTPDKVYERAIKPEKFPAKSPLIKAAEKFKKASWANYSKTWLERISFIPKEDFNRASMEKVTQTVLDKLGALIDVGLDEDVIHGTGHIAVKYKQGNKQHYVIMPTNKIQKKAIEAMPKEHRRAPRKVLKTLQASTAEHFTRPNTETKSGVQPS